MAKNFSTSKDVVNAWYESVSHKENLLNENYDEVGFAVVDGNLDGYETTLVVQMFGRPKNPLQIATKFDERSYLENLAQEPARAQVPSVQTHKTERVSVPEFSIDIPTATKSISSVFLTFVLLLLALDIWYSQKKGILKLSGHTYVHVLFLIAMLVGIWFVLKPGVVM